MRTSYPRALASRQAGLTLIEFMVSIVLGMIMVAALAVLIANQSDSRAQVDRAGRLIENGRYTMQVLADDLQLAGYWGEATAEPTAMGLPTAPAASVLPDPCSETTTSADAANPGIQEGFGVFVQAYDNSTFTSSTLTCTPNWKTGTDVLVVRRLDPDTSSILTAGVTDLTKLTSGQVYMQTGLTSATGTVFNYRFYQGDSASNSANFSLVKKTGTRAPPRKVLVHVYYVATCDVCTGANADSIPSLKRVELGVESGQPDMKGVTIAQGVENMQVDFGVDTDGDGAPDGGDVNPSNGALGTTPANWQTVVGAKVYLLVRGTETTSGFTDAKTYCMGTSFPAPSSCLSPAAGTAGYQRHLFVQTVRLVNPSFRRTL